jgi:L-arabinose isomerase
MMITPATRWSSRRLIASATGRRSSVRTHLHTQVNVGLLWATIDMDFMNLNQAAHGDREFGYLQTRLGIARTTVAGHVSDPAVIARIGTWTRAAWAGLSCAA